MSTKHWQNDCKATTSSLEDINSNTIISQKFKGPLYVIVCLCLVLLKNQFNKRSKSS